MARHMNPWIGWALAIAVAAGFGSLGFWQLGRAQQKQAMFAEAHRVLEERIAGPLSLAADASRSRNYDWAVGEGEFADAPAVLLDNQQRDGMAGVRAYRLFQPVGAPPLLVELGWLPLPPDRRMPGIALPQGRLRVRGLLSPAPSAGMVREDLKKTDDADNLLTTVLDVTALSPALGVESLPSRALKLDPALKLGYTRDLDILPNTMPPARHVAYAVQWFGLALAVLATAAVLTFRRRRAGRAKMPA